MTALRKGLLNNFSLNLSFRDEYQSKNLPHLTFHRYHISKILVQSGKQSDNKFKHHFDPLVHRH